MDLTKVHARIPGSILYPDSRISVPLWPTAFIDIDSTGIVSFRKEFHDGAYADTQRITGIDPRFDDAQIADILISVIEGYMVHIDEIVEELRNAYTKDTGNESVSGESNSPEPDSTQQGTVNSGE